MEMKPGVDEDRTTHPPPPLLSCKENHVVTGTDKERDHSKDEDKTNATVNSMVKVKVTTCRDPPTVNPKDVPRNNGMVVSPPDPVKKYTFEEPVNTINKHNKAHENCYKCTEEKKAVPPE